MVQEWVIMAPGKREFFPTESEGKLSAMLFDGSGPSLVMLLTTPVLPRRQTYSFENRKYAGAGGIPKQRDDHPERTTKPLRKKQKQRHINSRVTENKDTASLSKLPTELLRMIFGQLEVGKDLLFLSLTCRLLWAIGRKHIEDYHASYLAPWAGRQIICVGEDVEVNDLPPGITYQEKDKITPLTNKKGQPIPLYDVCDYFDERDRVKLPLGPMVFFYGWEEFSEIAESDRQQILRTVHQSLADYYPEDQPWILRNLTTKEYVRSAAVALKPEYIHGPNIKHLGFGEIILTRICWSSSGSTGMKYDGNIHRGIWAGHRIDITTLARHEQDRKEEEWKDVSDEVMAEVARIWESEYGANWREIVTQ